MLITTKAFSARSERDNIGWPTYFIAFYHHYIEGSSPLSVWFFLHLFYVLCVSRFFSDTGSGGGVTIARRFMVLSCCCEEGALGIFAPDHNGGCETCGLVNLCYLLAMQREVGVVASDWKGEWEWGV